MLGQMVTPVSMLLYLLLEHRLSPEDDSMLGQMVTPVSMLLY